MRFLPSKTVELLLMSLLLSLFLAQTSGAETRAGDLEFNGQFSFVNNNLDDIDDDFNTTAWILRVGYFFTKEMQAEGGLTLSRTDFGDLALTSFALDGRFNYHFLTSGVVIPYVGPAFGISTTTVEFGGIDDSDTGVIFGGQVGLKSFVTENVAITTEFNVRRSGGFETDFTNLTLLAGISWFWRQN